MVSLLRGSSARREEWAGEAGAGGGRSILSHGSVSTGGDRAPARGLHAEEEKGMGPVRAARSGRPDSGGHGRQSRGVNRGGGRGERGAQLGRLPRGPAREMGQGGCRSGPRNQIRNLKIFKFALSLIRPKGCLSKLKNLE
jgi:hypothetical protein